MILHNLIATISVYLIVCFVKEISVDSFEPKILRELLQIRVRQIEISHQSCERCCYLEVGFTTPLL